MPAQQRTLQVPRTANLYQLGTLTQDTKDLWLVCHGYGQLARYFIRHFEILEDAATVVIAPEGLSKFYLQGFSGRVGATWMTKEERLSEIEDYITYLNLVLAQALEQAPKARLHVLGFSQGAATVCRWLAQVTHPVQALTLWAGVFPDDMEIAKVSTTLHQARLTYVYGLQDEFVAEGRIQEQLNRVLAAGLQPAVITFEGKHELNVEVLLRLKSSHN